MATVRATVRENIRALVESVGGPKEFADRVGVSRQAVNNWINESSAPDIERIADIAHKFGLKLSDLLTDTDGLMPSVGAFAPVPLLGAVAGGTPIEMIEDRMMKEAPSRFLEDDPDCFMVRMNGNSENRRGIFDGDFVLVSPKYREPKPGELFLVTVNGDEATLKEVAVLENGIELIPDSYDPTYTRQIYDFNDPDTPPVNILAMYKWHCAPF